MISELFDGMKAIGLDVCQFISSVAEITSNEPDPILLVDSNGIIFFSNPAVKRKLGWESEKLNGNAVEVLLPFEMREGHVVSRENYMLCPIARQMNDGRVFEVRKFDGTVTPFKIALNPLKQLKLVEVRMRDVSDDIAAANILIDERKSAENAAKGLSHDIKTPLQSLFCLIDMLKSTGLTPEQATIINDVTSVTDSISAIAKYHIEGIELASFSVKILLENQAKIYELQLNSKNIIIHVEVDNSLPAFVRGDYSSIVRLTGNLISNAVKYTESGKVVIRANRMNSSDFLRFEVEDTGTGLSEVELAYLFQREWRSPQHSDIAGTGVGLYASKALVEKRLRGRIGAISTLGKGSLFWFEVPLPEDSSKSVDSVSVNFQMENLTEKTVKTCASCPISKRIFVVDDSKMTQQLLVRQIKSLGYDCDAAENGVYAIEMIVTAGQANNSYDLILTDYQMPLMNGIELSKQIRLKADIIGNHVIPLV